ncbi:amidohydrolase [Agromyces mediolanus]|uniref:amidohydrolase n=1 Tax=Agromyces mediolanus TaxID=41986 RepID=UPI003838A710
MRIHPPSKAPRLLAIGLAAVAVAGALAACTPTTTSDADAADTVLTNGFVWTVDADDSVQQAVAITDGEIVYVGDDAGARKFIGERTETIDLGGKMVMPGIQDAHIHTFLGGDKLTACNLNFESLTIPQFQEKIQGCLDEEGDTDKPLIVETWYRQAMQPQGVKVDKSVLDALDTDRAVLVYTTDGHSVLLNTKALEAANITSEDSGPPHIEVDANGVPNGILEEGAAFMARAKIVPPRTLDESVASASAAMSALSAVGVTAYMDQLSGEDVASAMTELRERGELTTRVFLAPNISAELGKTDPRAAVDEVVAFREQWATDASAEEPGIAVNNVAEFGLDGVLQAPALTASFLEPYYENFGTEEAPDWRPGTNAGPEPEYTAEQMGAIVALLLDEDITPEPHAIGDRAVRTALDAFEIARAQSDSDTPLAIAHAESVHPDDLARFAELDVLPAMGLQWAKPAFDSIDAAQDTLGPERFARTEPIGSLADAGAQVANGSDWPVDPLNPFASLQISMTRENPEGGDRFPGKLGEDRGLTIEEAIRAMTINPARIMHGDATSGSIEVGKFADLIVLDRNLTEVPVDEIVDTKVELTLLGGKAVYGKL